MLIISNAFANLRIDMDKIIFIESSHNEMAFNPRTEARGLFQITPILLEEWNNFHPKKIYNTNDLHEPKISLEIASWYLGKRIPEMLLHYKKPVNISNILICWNAGIRYVTNSKKLPKETVNFIRKYESKESNN